MTDVATATTSATTVPVQWVIWNEYRRAYVAAEGTGMFYTVNVWDARVYPSEKAALGWCKEGERPQKMIGA
jgi:hypothetical protein